MELKHFYLVISTTRQLSFNRTLWNWNKHELSCQRRDDGTFNRTLWNWNTTIGNSLHLRLAFNRTLWNWNKVFISSSRSFIILLIVPYGIETPNSNVRVVVVNAAFNRTLWNWNSYNIMTVPEYRTFNRTLWNWNSSIPFRNFCK